MTNKINLMLAWLLMLFFFSCGFEGPEQNEIEQPKKIEKNLSQTSGEAIREVQVRAKAIEKPKNQAYPPKKPNEADFTPFDQLELKILVQIHASEAIHSKHKIGQSRKMLLREMNKNPKQLHRDSIGFTSLNIGEGEHKTVITGKIANEKKANELFEMICEAIRKYISSFGDRQKSELLHNNEKSKKIGQFWLGELIYPLVQTFTAKSFIQFGKDYSEIIAELAPLPGSVYSINILYSPKKDILTVTGHDKKTFVDLRNDSENQYYATNSTIFYLKSGKVRFSFSYEFNGKKKKWSDKNPFPK